MVLYESEDLRPWEVYLPTNRLTTMFTSPPARASDVIKGALSNWFEGKSPLS